MKIYSFNAARASSRGFTLLELMMAIAVLAIVLGLAVPSFKDSMRNSKLTGQTNELVWALSVARSEAIRRNINVSICPGANSTCVISKNWSTGWIVFTDNSGTEGKLDGTDIALSNFEANTSVVSIASTANYVTFTPRDVAAQTIFTVSKDGCPLDRFARTVAVELSGKIGSLKTPCP